MSRRSGILVRNEITGREGIAYHDEQNDAKDSLNVHVTRGEYFVQTGEKVIWKKRDCKRFGNVD